VAIDPAALPYLDGAIRVVLGPQDDRFTAEGIATFLSGEYALTAEADRMGYRLDGPEIEHRDGFNTISDTILTGSIQVPGTRKPIVLMADRQTTGGYPKIATTATASLPTLAQMKPGDRLRFAAVGVAEARALLARQVEAMRALPAALRPVLRDASTLTSEALLATNLIDGVVGPDA
jgi:allophanate hydrolase subunit 2